MQGLLDYNTYSMSRQEKIKYIAMGVGALFVVGFIFFNNLLVAMVLAGGGFFYPRYKEEELAKKRRQELNLQFRDALYSLNSALRAGRSLEGAFGAALKDLQVLYPGGEAFIIREFEYICRRLELNEPVEAALQDFALRSGLEDIRNFADVVAICKRTGGNLVQVVKNTSNIISDKIEIFQEIELNLAKQRYEQKILNIMPVVFIALIKFGGSGYMDPLYQSVKGYLLMGVALVILGVAFLISRKIFDIKV